jgi:hypothetical protein
MRLLISLARKAYFTSYIAIVHHVRFFNKRIIWHFYQVLGTVHECKIGVLITCKK